MPAMAGDWPRDPRAYGSPQHTEPPAPVRTLPSVAELLSTRPSANTTIPAYQHRQDYLHARSTPPSASSPPITATSTANSTAPSYWKPVNHHRHTSPPVSPTEQRPSTETARVYQQAVLRRQHPPKPDPALQDLALSPALHSASHSAVQQARQDSAIDQHRFDTANDAQLLKSNISYSHQSPSNDQGHITPGLSSYHPAPSTPAYAPSAAPYQREPLPDQAGAHPRARRHSKSVSSAAPYSASSPRPHEQNTDRTVPVDVRNGSDSRPNITGPSSLPEQFFTQQSNFGTRQQRYNVRFAANYTSENMPPLQKPRNEPPTPPTPPIAPAVVAEPEEATSSPLPSPVQQEPPTPASNGSTRHVEPPPSRPAREPVRERGDGEPSVERCIGCNEAWRRPIPDMDNDQIAPAQDNAEYMRLAGNLIDRLRNERKKADAAYEEWKWRHSHCYRQPSPYSTGSVEDAPKASAANSHAEGATNGHTTTNNKRKSEVPLESHSASKQQKVSSTSPPPADREPGSS